MDTFATNRSRAFFAAASESKLPTNFVTRTSNFLLAELVRIHDATLLNFGGVLRVDASGLFGSWRNILITLKMPGRGFERNGLLTKVVLLGFYSRC